MNKFLIILILGITLSFADAVMCPVSHNYPDKLLRHTYSKITIIIHGSIAETIIESEIKNEWNQQTGGIYSFPLPLDANATGLWFDYKRNYHQAILIETPQIVNPGTGEGGFTAELNRYLGRNAITFKIDSLQSGGFQHVILRYIQKMPYSNRPIYI